MVTDEIVLIGSCSGRFYALDRENGAEIWSYDTGARIVSVAVDEQFVFATGADRSIHCLNRVDGEISASLELEGKPLGRMLLAESVDDAGWSSYQPLLWRGAVWIGDFRGDIHAYRLRDGEELATMQVEGKVRGLGSAGQDLFVGTLEGTVYAVSWPGN